MITRMVDVGERLKGVGNKREYAPILVKRKAVERLEPAGLPIDASHSLSFPEGRIEVSGKAGKCAAGQNRVDQVLLVALRIDEEEKFVLNDRPAQATAELIPLKWISRIIRQSGIERLVAKIVEGITVQAVGARFC